MQLREYWTIVRRHLWLVLGLPAITLLASGYLAMRGPTAYCSSMKLAVGIIPEPREGPAYKYDLYYPWLASEYLADDLTEVVKSQAFAQDVSSNEDAEFLIGHNLRALVVAHRAEAPGMLRRVVRVASDSGEAAHPTSLQL